MVDDLQQLSLKESEKFCDPLTSVQLESRDNQEFGKLPYYALGGLGFERLCYELELLGKGKKTDRKRVSLFGKSGQKDYGVDVVVDEYDGQMLIQCKNFAEIPTWAKIKKTICDFEEDWFEVGKFAAPKRYVYCCSQPLNDTKIQKPWLEFAEEFEQRRGVKIELRGRDELDAKLKHLPDLVAGYFGATIAEQFCVDAQSWRTAPWERICREEIRNNVIARFLERHDSKRIYVKESEQEAFNEALELGSAVLIRGLPGAGKTVTGLELASRYSRVRRIYYTTLRNDPGINELLTTAQRRCSRPSIFVLDDCHLNLEIIQRFRERLRPELQQGLAMVVFMCRDVEIQGEERDESELIEDLRQENLVIDFKLNLERVREIIEFLRPDFVGLSKKRFKRLYHITGGDLFLLDEVLQDQELTPEDIDQFTSDKFYRQLCSRYFNRKSFLPTIRRLAGLAQFDLLPLSQFFADSWNSSKQEKEFAKGLMVEVMRPPRYCFLHSSLSELVSKALSVSEIPKNLSDAELDNKILNQVKQELVEYFQRLVQEVERGTYPTNNILLIQI